MGLTPRSRFILVFLLACSLLGLWIGPLALVQEGLTGLSTFLCFYSVAHFFLVQTGIASLFEPSERVWFDQSRLIQVRWYKSIPVVLLFPSSKVFLRLLEELRRISNTNREQF